MICASGVAAAQKAVEASASRAYYERGTGSENSIATGVGKRGIVRTPGTEAKSAAGRESKGAKAGLAAPDAKSAPPSGLRMGIRYNLLDVDPKGTRAPVAVAADAMWKVGQCAAVRLEVNRGGFLYVLAQGSSGAWQPLIPSADAAGEPLAIQPYTPATIPREHCFEILPPAGKERLFIVVSERKEDMAELERALRNSDKSGGAQTGSSGATIAKLNEQVAKLRGELQGRDIKIQKISQPARTSEPPHSVFVVAADARQNDRMMVEIEIQH